MQNVLRLDDTLTEAQLKKTLELLLTRASEKVLTPEQQREFSLDKENFVNTLYLSLTKKDNELKLEHLQNDNIMNNLFVNIMSTTMLEKHFDKKFTDDLVLELKKINPKFDPKLINKPEDLKKFFNEDQLKNILNNPKLQAKMDSFFNDFKSQLTPLSTKPEPAKKKLDDIENDVRQDPYTNLFGLISSSIPGGHPAVVQVYLGNAYNLPDWNPHHGMSGIDTVNRTDDNVMAGDPLGLNATAVRNYLTGTGVGEDLVDQLQNEVRLTPPTYKPGQ